MANIVGDKSTGKTQLAIEACANFHRLYGGGRTRYLDAENAFDTDYAEALGFPGAVQPEGGIRTVEDFAADLSGWLQTMGTGRPCLYVVDSYDSLSDEAELKRDMGEGTYGTAKAKLGSELFRRMVGPLSDAQCALLIISQTRKNIGVTFGEQNTRSGGKALDFYASQIVWLHHKGQIKRTVNKLERVIGADVRALVKKNKIAPNFRDAEFSIFYNYGIDDESSMLAWLAAVGAEEAVRTHAKMGVAQLQTTLKASRAKGEYDVLDDLHDALRTACLATWEEIESRFRPQTRKYRAS